jgi:hypothetical protein
MLCTPPIYILSLDKNREATMEEDQFGISLRVGLRGIKKFS